MSRGCLAPPEVKEFKEFKVSRGSQGESRAVVFMVIDSHVIVHSPGPKHVTVVSKLRHLRHTYFGTTVCRCLMHRSSNMRAATDDIRTAVNSFVMVHRDFTAAVSH